MASPYEQKKILSILPHVTAPFSIAGSAYVIYEILSDRKKWKKPYHRILFSMCVFDLISSFALGLSTWPIPRGSPGVYAPMGTRATCSAQAFFIQANIASPIYNFVLSLYYLLRIRYNMNDRQLGSRIEPVMQASTMFFALGTSFICLGLGFFNDSSLWCWINALPKGCEQSFKFGSTTCDRGDNAEIFRWAFFFGPLWAAAVGSMITMAMLYWAVHSQERRADRWNFKSQTVERRSSASTRDYGERRRRFRKSRMVARQAFRYVAVFYLTWIAGTSNRLLQLFWGRSYFWIMVLHAIFTPMQGFFNFLVYKYPAYKKWKKRRLGQTDLGGTRFSRTDTIITTTRRRRVTSMFTRYSVTEKSKTNREVDGEDEGAIEDDSYSSSYTSSQVKEEKIIISTAIESKQNFWNREEEKEEEDSGFSEDIEQYYSTADPVVVVPSVHKPSFSEVHGKAQSEISLHVRFNDDGIIKNEDDIQNTECSVSVASEDDGSVLSSHFLDECTPDDNRDANQSLNSNNSRPTYLEPMDPYFC